MIVTGNGASKSIETKGRQPNCFNKIALNTLNSDKTDLFIKYFDVNIAHTL